MTDTPTPPVQEKPVDPKPPVTQDNNKFPVDLFITDASHNVSVQGLLAHEPSLRTAELSVSEWEAKLEAYNKTRIK